MHYAAFNATRQQCICPGVASSINGIMLLVEEEPVAVYIPDKGVALSPNRTGTMKCPMCGRVHSIDHLITTVYDDEKNPVQQSVERISTLVPEYN